MPNPGIRPAQLLATMKGDDGRVLVEGFYDGIAPLAAEEKAMLDAVPDEPAALMKLFGIAPCIETLGFPAMSIPIVNFDNNQHRENENLRIGHFFRGIVTFAAVLTM